MNASAVASHASHRVQSHPSMSSATMSDARHGSHAEKGDGQSNKRLSRPAHALSIEQFVTEIGANVKDGLTEEEAQRRFDIYGPNMYKEEKGISKIRIILSQFRSPMALVCLSIVFPS